MRSKIKQMMNDNQGSALIVALVASVVVMTFALSLLLVSYSLLSSVNKRNMDMQVRELSQSVATYLEEELTEVEFADHEAMQQAFNAGEHTFWFYVRCNMGKNTGWPYYNEDEKATGHGIKNATKVFHVDVNGVGTDEWVADDIQVSMYWEKPKKTGRPEWNGAKLYITVTVTKGEASYAAKRVLTLTAKNEALPTPIDPVVWVNSDINPRGNAITPSEMWRWGLGDD